MTLVGPISLQGRCGYIDDAGVTRIPFVYDDLGDFSEGLAGFVKDQKLGFITPENRVAIPAVFDPPARLGMICQFCSGLAPVQVQSKAGYIDRSGVFKIPCEFEVCSRFVGEIALVSAKEHGFSVIDRNGEIVSRLPFDDVAEAPYESDLIKVYPRINNEVAPGFVNRHGALVAGPFEELREMFGFCLEEPFFAVAWSRSDDRAGFLNRRWETAIPFQYTNAFGFSEGLAGASTPEHLWGFIDVEGTWAVSPEYSDVHQFQNGAASVRRGRGRVGKWFVINRHNQRVSDGVYDSITDLNDGFRCVWSGNEVMVLNPECRVIWSVTEGKT